MNGKTPSQATPPTASTRKQLAILCDYREEKWVSMDLAAEMLRREIESMKDSAWDCETLRPPYVAASPLIRLALGARRHSHLERATNRLWHYPRYLRQHQNYTLFHVCDHSYAHLLHSLPVGRAGAFCHDIDTYRCLLEPQQAPRSYLFRQMTKSIVSGLQKAAVVFHPTMETREELLRYKLVPAERLVLAPNGVAEEFTPGASDPTASIRARSSSPYLLNVGTCIPRKRIDSLLDIFAATRAAWPDLRLVQIGGTWTPSQEEQIDRLGIRREVRQLRNLERAELATFYREAAIVVQPTEAEGFGLPIVEALACGAVVIASDIPVLREVGGNAVIYRAVGQTDAWRQAILAARDGQHPDWNTRKQQAERFTWHAQAKIILDTYDQLLS